jgi:hypothetical protein
MLVEIQLTVNYHDEKALSGRSAVIGPQSGFHQLARKRKTIDWKILPYYIWKTFSVPAQ